MNEKPKDVIQSSKPIVLTLKTIATDELAKLPELLESLEAKERVSFLMKILPYTVPKIDSVHHRSFDD